MTNLFNRALPKWPKMLVTGESVTIEQAKEIIRRTDTFFEYAPRTSRGYVGWVKSSLKIPEGWRELRRWQESWGLIRTEYVHNSWISSSFIYGPHGWCHPDGTIAFGDNIGKWPSVSEVLSDWTLLAKEFPFLNLDVTLFDGEECEDNILPVVSITVRSGEAIVCEPIEWHEGSMLSRSGESFNWNRSKHAICDDWIAEWAQRC